MIEKLERYAQGVFGVQAHKDGNYCMYASARAREDALLESLKMIVSFPCPIITHHRENCEWCKALKVIDDIEATR